MKNAYKNLKHSQINLKLQYRVYKIKLEIFEDNFKCLQLFVCVLQQNKKIV